MYIPTPDEFANQHRLELPDEVALVIGQIKESLDDKDPTFTEDGGFYVEIKFPLEHSDEVLEQSIEALKRHRWFVYNQGKDQEGRQMLRLSYP